MPRALCLGDSRGAPAALLDVQREEIAYLRVALDAEREARRRADTIIIELSRQVVALPAGQDAAVDANKGPGATKTVL